MRRLDPKETFPLLAPRLVNELGQLLQVGDFEIAALSPQQADGGQPAAPPTGNPDVDFLATMIPHHAGAVEMARLALVHGRDPLVRRLAEEIIAGQRAEIAAMEARLRILRQGADPDPDGYPSKSAWPPPTTMASAL